MAELPAFFAQGSSSIDTSQTKAIEDWVYLLHHTRGYAFISWPQKQVYSSQSRRTLGNSVTSYVIAQDIITMGCRVFAITHAFLERFYVPILAVVQNYLSKSAFILWFVRLDSKS